MKNSLLNSLPALLPGAYEFAEKHEAIILAQGEPLSPALVEDARRAHVMHPEKIRIVYVVSLPEPQNGEMMFVAKHMGLFQPRSIGLTFGHGIYLRLDCRENRQMIVHECVHIGQYERLGGIRPFLDMYLRECIEPGYPFGALEQEAILVSREICKSDPEAKV